MDKLNLTINTRLGGLSPNKLRDQGEVPGIVYGKNVDSLMISIPTPELKKVYKDAGETTIINLIVDGKKTDPIMALIKDTQVSPDRGEFLHVDFYRIKLGEKLRVIVPLSFKGEPPAVKNFGGILVTNKNEVEIECLPKDLINEIVIDLTGLENIEDAITIKDLKVSEVIEILDNKEESVAVIIPPQQEEKDDVVSEEEAIDSVEATGEKTEEGMENSSEEVKSETKEDSKE